MEIEQQLYTIVLLYYTREHYSNQLLHNIVLQMKVITPLSIVYFCTTIKMANLTISESNYWTIRQILLHSDLFQSLKSTVHNYDNSLLLYLLLNVQQLMKSIVTNRLTLLPIKLLTDITTFRAAIAAKLLSCITYILL